MNGKIPDFVTMKYVTEFVKGEKKKPIQFVLLGAVWSPAARYTMETLQELMKDEKNSELIDVFFVDQDKDLKFCFYENIPIGFPTLIVFVNSYLVPFIGEKQQTFDPSKRTQKNRLIRQLNPQHFKSIIQGAIDVLEEKANAIQFVE